MIFMFPLFRAISGVRSPYVLACPGELEVCNPMDKDRSRRASLTCPSSFFHLGRGRVRLSVSATGALVSLCIPPTRKKRRYTTMRAGWRATGCCMHALGGPALLFSWVPPEPE